MNFSLFGIAVIFSVGGLIIAVSYALEPFVSWLQGKRGLDAYARLEWCANETLQLQRLAHEELGVGTWSGADETVPVTRPGECLAGLDIADPRHPRLKSRSVLCKEEALASSSATLSVSDSCLSQSSEETVDVSVQQAAARESGASASEWESIYWDSQSSTVGHGSCGWH